MGRGQKSLDLNIRGDELEKSRIQLEQNLQHTDLSLHLSSAPEDDYGSNSSVEYPRRNSGPAPFEFASFEHPSRDNYDLEGHSHLHGWSYRTADDEDGINPYIGETLSTAAHHASALTLSAGLGGRGGRRDVSLSGAEYDPDRPLQEMIDGVDSRFSIYDIDRSRSKNQATMSLNFDPLVVDDSADLDRVLGSGQATVASISRLRSPLLSSSSSSSDTESIQSQPRPKLSDALHRVAFSPKRPRSAQSSRSLYASQRDITPRHLPPASHVSPSPFAPDRSSHTPKGRKRPTPSHPQVHVQPPTPSTAGSKFTRMARGLAREIETEQTRWDTRSEGHRVRVHEIDNEMGQPPLAQSTIRSPRPRRSVSAKTPRGNRIHLPDVTGLTSAVESPMKAGQEYVRYEGDQRPREAEVRLLATLSAVQAKLSQLEDENSISRRRVRELEMELEACKAEVRRERSRVIYREDTVRQATETRRRQEADNSRYVEVVEEKKALEALISTLRSHLTRLTSELSSHQQLLAELRELRDSDHRTLTDKAEEIDRLKSEVERLGGEVEVLRGVVEDGLKERRENSRLNITVSEHEEEDADRGVPDEEEVLSDHNRVERAEQEDEADEVTQRTDRTDRSRPFVSAEEIDPISMELEERQESRENSRMSMASSNRSGGNASQDIRDEEVRSNRSASRSMNRSRAERSELEGEVTQRTERSERSRAFVTDEELSRISEEVEERRSERSIQRNTSTAAETPFPQIRGGQLERLFFSAPEHNARTCTVCHRRRRDRPQSPSVGQPTSWLPGRSTGFKARVEDAPEDDEGFAEGSDEADREAINRILRDVKGKGKQQERHASTSGKVAAKEAEGDRLPPQTVLARVLRELEDDFTHYKSIYVELADQYKVIDAVSNVPKRNILAQHLREVVDILEQKGDQIASLYDLLTLKDKPVSESVVPPKAIRSVSLQTSSWRRSRGPKKHTTFE